MSDFRVRARTILMKIEGTPGVDAAPTVGANAVKMTNPSSGNNLELLDTNEVTRSIDKASRVTGGGSGTFTGGVILKGSGTAGTAPEYGAGLRACFMSETLLAADATGTAQAGTSNSIQVADSSIAADGDHVGMVIETTGGTGPNQTRVITASVASTDTLSVYPDWDVTPDATTTYALRACALYRPASTGEENLTVYEYLHKKGAGNHILRKRLGVSGTWSLVAPTRQLATLDFTMTGKLVPDADVTDPGSATYDNPAKVPVLSAKSYLDGIASKQRQVSLDYGGGVAVTDDPADQFGVGAAGVVERQLSGRINPPKANVATRDVLSDLIAGATKPLWLSWGSVAGSRVSIFCPTIRYTGDEDEDIDGFLNTGIPFDCGGIDTGVYLCFF